MRIRRGKIVGFGVPVFAPVALITVCSDSVDYRLAANYERLCALLDRAFPGFIVAQWDTSEDDFPLDFSKILGESVFWWLDPAKSGCTSFPSMGGLMPVNSDTEIIVAHIMEQSCANYSIP